MMCNIDCGAIPIKVPPADAFIPYVNRAEIAAEEAEKNAQQAKEAVESITDISNQVEQVQQLAQQAKESEVNANASAQIATNKANEVNENAQIASAKATEAAASASSIKGIENIVKNYKDEASVSATTAIDKANEAGDSATKAKASETSASASAQTATTKANEANASATIATDKASEASVSAASAKTSENKANEYAKEAKDYVDSIDTSNIAKLAEDNTFNGINTFNNTINVPEPADDSNAINKSYGDTTYSKIENTMNIKTLTAPLDDWCNLQTGIYAVDTANFFSSATLNKPNVPQGGICMVYNTGEYAQLEFFPDNYNGNPSAPKCVKRKVKGKWSGWFTEKAPIFLFVSPAMTGKPTAPTATPDTKTTQVATTEFAHSILQRAVGKTQPTLTALIDWDAMATANGGKDVRTHSSSDIYVYNGVSALNGGDIILKQAYTNYDALFVLFSTNDGSFKNAKLIPLWELNTCLDTQGNTCFVDVSSISWNIKGKRNTTNPSTDTRFNIYSRSCGMIEIYGVSY